MTPEETIWHTKTKYKFLLGGGSAITIGMVLSCFANTALLFLWIGIPIMVFGFVSFIYGTSRDD